MVCEDSPQGLCTCNSGWRKNDTGTGESPKKERLPTKIVHPFLVLDGGATGIWSHPAKKKSY
jgi:hypothetical protein